MITSKADQSHFALRWIIRSAGAVIAVCASLILLRVMSAIFIGWSHSQEEISLGRVVTGLIVELALFWVVGLIVKMGWKMWHIVDADAVSNFAAIWALLTAWDIYHLWPTYEAFFRLNDAERWAHEFHELRMLGSIGIFLLLNRLGRYGLISLLELNPTIATKHSLSPAPEIPEYPRKSPLVEL